MIGARLRAFREILQIPRTKFAVSIGCGGERIAAYESGRARLPYWVFRSISKRYDLYPGWLNDGIGLPQIKDSFNDSDFIDKIPRHFIFTEVFDKHLAAQIKAHREQRTASVKHGTKLILELLHVFTDETVPKKEREEALRVMAGPVKRLNHVLMETARVGSIAKNVLLKVLEEPEYRGLKGCKPEVDNTGAADSINFVSAKIRTWKALQKQLAIATSEKGAKAQLARDLDTSRQAVNKWLNGSGAPSADLTLRLLQWVEQRGQK